MSTVDERPRTGLSRTASGEPVPSAADRARRPHLDDALLSWVWSIGLTLLAFGLRLWHLEEPKQFAFDETYYAKDAWSLVENGITLDHHAKVDGVEVNQAVLDGTTTGIWQDNPSMVVHPEVGKWLIGAGEWMFGMDPFGWRFASAVVGSLMVLVMIRLMRRMTGSTLLGCIAGVLLMIDGLHLVLSRLALLDIFLAFFLLCGVACVVYDRYWLRDHLARGVSWKTTLFRPWLLLGGLSLGLAVGTKWTAVFPAAALGLLVWIWSAGARRSFGTRLSAWQWLRALLRSALVDGVPAFVQLVVLGAIVYTLTWVSFLTNAGEYEEHLSATQYRQYTGQGHCDGDDYVSDHPDTDARWPTATADDATGIGEVTQSLRSLWYYHQDLYVFHAHFLNCSSHTYGSDPLGWLVLNRPVGVSVDNEIPPDGKCEAATPTEGETEAQASQRSNCLRQTILLGNPVLWWGGVLALLYSVVRWVGGRDWRFGLAVVGTLTTWLPWLRYDDRPIFLFYAIATLPFVVMALTLTIGSLIGAAPPGEKAQPTPRRTTGVIVAGAFVVLALVNFAWFWPIWTNELLTRPEWLDRIWFDRWI